MPGLPAGLSGLFHLCEGSCLCATSPNGKTNRVLYCYGEVVFNCLILYSTSIIYNHFYCYGEVLFNCLILLSTITSTTMERSCLINSSYHLLSFLPLWRCLLEPSSSVHLLLSLLLLRYMFKFTSHIKFQCLESFSTVGKLTFIKARWKGGLWLDLNSNL